jgi:hypothetical protein
VALSDEQRAMLQLLLEGGQGYDDIGGLLGIPADEVRSRARAALGEIGGADPDATVGLTDYLLGKADPIGRADAVRGIQNDPDTNALASRLVAQLRLLAPRAELPEIPQPRGGRREPPPPAPSAAPPLPSPVTGAPVPTPGAPAPSARDPVPARLAGMLSGLDRRVLFGLGAVALLAVAVIVALTVFGGDGDDDESPGESTVAGDLVAVELGPLEGGSDASGQAAFAQSGNQPFLRINATGLQPSGADQRYIVWLYNSNQIAFPIAQDRAPQGNLRGDVPIPSSLNPTVFGCIDVSLANVNTAQRAFRQSIRSGRFPPHSGTSVLRGEIPQPGQTAPTGSDAQCARAPEADAGADTGAGPGGEAPSNP